MLALLLLQNCQARLGDAEAYLTGRYGEPRSVIKVDDRVKEMIFTYEGWGIRASVLDGVCQCIKYSRSPFNENYDEVRDKLFQANGPGQTWTLEKVPGIIFSFPTDIYVRADKGAYAYIPKQTTFRGEFFSAQWIEYQNAKKAAKKKPAPLPNF